MPLFQTNISDESIDSQVYFLGYEGFGIYNLADNTLRLMPITFRGQHIEPPKTDDYQRGLRDIKSVKTLSDLRLKSRTN